MADDDTPAGGLPRREQLRRLAVAVVVVAAVVLGVTWLKNEMNKPDPEPQLPAELEVRYVCEDWVREKLVAPSDAEFGDSSVSGAGPWTVTGTVDSPNRLGVTVRADYTCEIRRDGNSWRGTVDLDE